MNPPTTHTQHTHDKTGVGREVWVMDKKSQPKLQSMVERRVTECLEAARIVAGDSEGHVEVLQISILSKE